MNRKVCVGFVQAILFVFLYGSFSVAKAQEIAPLLPKAPVSRDFKTGERQLFAFTAQAREVVEVLCERRGVDLGMKALTPKGEIISVSNAPSGFAGFDRLFFIAPDAGEYRIEITSRRPGNLAGSYTITLKEARAADENDSMRAAAFEHLGAAREILFGAENRLEKASKALERLGKALSLFEKSGDLQGQANTLFQMALIDGYEFGDKKSAIDSYEKALAIWSKIDDEAGKAICLTYLADEMRDYDSLEKEREYYVEKSRKYFDEALLLHRKLNDKPDEAATLAYLCRLHNDTANFQKGFDACRQSLQIGGDADPLTDYRTYGNLASLFANSGDLQKALENNFKALERLAMVENHLNPYRVAFIKSNIGGLLFNQKKYAEAEKFLDEALQITESVKRDLYSGYILVRLSAIYSETDRLPKALTAAQKAVEYYRAVDPMKIQGALNALGKINQSLGKTDEARALYAEAVEANRRTKDRYAEADSLYNLAKLENQTDNLEAALTNIELAVSNSEVIRAQLLGKNQRTTYLSILKKYYELEIELLIKFHEKTGDAAYLEKAWQTHEKIRARSLMESLIESGLNLNEFAPKDFFSKEQVLLEAIAANELRRTEALKTKNENLQRAAEKALNKNLEDYEVLQEGIRQKNPQFSAVNQPKNFSLADAQNLLDNDTMILEFALGEKQSYVWMIGKNSFKIAKLAGKTEINKDVREFYLALTDRTTTDDKTIIEKSQDLSHKILSPVRDDLKSIGKVIVIADGSLQLIPFSALTLTPEDAEYRPATTNFEIINAPSFSSLVFLHDNKVRRSNADNKLAAVFADPIFQEDDERFSMKKPKIAPSDKVAQPQELARVMRDFGIDRLARLPFSGIEAREIEKFAPGRIFLALGANASRQNFLQGNFNSYRYLHFATHGFLNQQNPELSGLVLSLYDEKRNSQNGFLRVIDLYSLHLNTELVVLSACQTALGKDIDGEGIVGLTRGFMYAGASGVVSSLWKVEDAATAELMKRFYRQMITKDKTPSEALRLAQLEMRAMPRFSSPRNWAGFTLNGEWR